MGSGFAGCSIVAGVLPVCRKDGTAEGRGRFEHIDVPIHGRRTLGVVLVLVEFGVWVVLVVVREEVGVGEELGAGGKELAVVRVDIAYGQEPWGIVGLAGFQVVDGLASGVGVVVIRGWERWVLAGRGWSLVSVGSLQVVPGRVGWAVPGESVGDEGVSGAAGDGDVPLAEVWSFVAGGPKELAEGRISRIENRNIGIRGDGADEPALMRVEAGDDGAASWRAGAGCGVVVGELYATFPDIFVEVGHEGFEVLFCVVDADGEDGRPTQFVDKDEDDVWFRSWFGDVLRETKASGDACACDSGGGFQEISAFHFLFSNG